MQMKKLMRRKMYKLMPRLKSMAVFIFSALNISLKAKRNPPSAAPMAPGVGTAEAETVRIDWQVISSPGEKVLYPKAR
mgnify:CR=1 FL=1